ncbi:MAG: Ig-like domain-containing protein [Methylococcaceae bacterium]
MTSATNYTAAKVAMMQSVRDLFPLAGPRKLLYGTPLPRSMLACPGAALDAPSTVGVSESGTKGLINFSATASDDKGLVKVEFFLDGALVGESIMAPYTMTYDSEMQDDSGHTLVAKGTDTSGQYSTATINFTIAIGQLIRNGSFKRCYGVGWSNTSGIQVGAILGQTAFDGAKMTKFCVPYRQ